jgi:hypothetical protein
LDSSFQDPGDIDPCAAPLELAPFFEKSAGWQDFRLAHKSGVNDEKRVSHYWSRRALYSFVGQRLSHIAFASGRLCTVEVENKP